MLPLLTTAENFALKLSLPPLRAAYGQADDTEQARLLDRLDAHAVLAAGDLTVLDRAPAAIDSIGWFASPLDIARVLDALRRRDDPRVLQILGVAPALPADLRDRFAYVCYKGGSETGLIALAWLVRNRSGEWQAITASWNDPDKPVDNARLERLAQRLVRLVADGS